MEKVPVSDARAPAQPTASDEQTGAYNQKWGQYMGSLARRGASRPVRRCSRSAKPSLDDAIAIAREVPHMALGGTTIVRPGVPIPG